MGLVGLECLPFARACSLPPVAAQDPVGVYHADGNGNITSLMDANQYMVARYLYDPYGRLLAKWGALADANVYRFSSKEWDQNSGLCYYLYRAYDPGVQRWLNRDPIQEEGGGNLYQFVGNDSVDEIDPFGLKRDPSCVAKCKQTWLVDCYNFKKTMIAASGGFVSGGALQQANMLGGTLVGKTGGLAGGGVSGKSMGLIRWLALKDGLGATGRFYTGLGDIARGLGRATSPVQRLRSTAVYPAVRRLTPAAK